MLYQLMEMVEQQNSTPESEFQIRCIYVSSDEASGWAGAADQRSTVQLSSPLFLPRFLRTMSEAKLTHRLYTQHSPIGRYEDP